MKAVGMRWRASSRLVVVPWTIVLSVVAAPTAFASESQGEPADACEDRWIAPATCSDRPWKGPQLEAGLALGAAAMNESGPLGFRNGVGSVTNAGPAWGLLVGVEVLPWLAFEGRYLGSYDSASASVSPSGGFLGSAGTAVVRLTVPLPYAHPYAFGGVGYYDFDFTGPSSSVIHSSSQAGIPMGIGLDVPLGYHLSVGAEAAFNFQLNEDFSSVTVGKIDGGDLTRFDLVLRARL